MKEPAPGAADLLVGHFTDAIMAEIVALLVLFADDAPRPKLVQRVDQCKLIRIHARFKDAKAEVTPDDSRRTGSLPGQG